MREAFCAKWDGVQWTPFSNDPPCYELVQASWPAGVTPGDLPVSRFKPGQRIHFRWGEGYLQGTIIEVWVYFRQESRVRITYEVREIGHRRSVSDDGTADITLL